MATCDGTSKRLPLNVSSLPQYIVPIIIMYRADVQTPKLGM